MTFAQFLAVATSCALMSLPASSLASDTEPRQVPKSSLMGAGILKRSTGSPCDFIADRSQKAFWRCEKIETPEVVIDGSFRFELSDGVFRISRDLSQSSEPEIDDLLVIPDALAKLVTFSCFPGTSISKSQLSVSGELSRAELEFNGNIRKLLTNDANTSKWEIDAFSVYRDLSKYCEVYYCQFASSRDTEKFWECHGDALVETLILPDSGIALRLRDQTFYVSVTGATNSAVRDDDYFHQQARSILGNVGCHPRLQLVDVPVQHRREGLSEERAERNSNRGELTFEMTNRFSAVELSVPAIQVYVNQQSICDRELTG